MKKNNLPEQTSDLGRWISVQRVNFKANELSKERIDLLEKIDGWVWEETKKSNDNLWMDNYKTLQKYLSKNKQLPKTRERIGSWCASQRSNYMRNKLSKERIELLEKIDGWSWNLSIKN